MMITTDSLISALPIFPFEISYHFKKENIKIPCKNTEAG